MRLCGTKIEGDEASTAGMARWQAFDKPMALDERAGTPCHHAPASGSGISEHGLYRVAQRRAFGNQLRIAAQPEGDQVVQRLIAFGADDTGKIACLVANQKQHDGPQAGILCCNGIERFQSTAEGAMPLDDFPSVDAWRAVHAWEAKGIFTVIPE
jgi:hypothetical protein